MTLWTEQRQVDISDTVVLCDIFQKEASFSLYVNIIFILLILGE